MKTKLIVSDMSIQSKVISIKKMCQECFRKKVSPHPQNEAAACNSAVRKRKQFFNIYSSLLKNLSF